MSDGEYEQSIEDARVRAEHHIACVWLEETKLEIDSINRSTGSKLTWEKDLAKIDTISYKDSRFFNAIWYASTEILPALEVQVVIDGNNNCHVTTGSSGYVEFGMKPPVGMKLPIKCWIHTHPFGSAYFSGVDWNTVNTWENLMQEAYVLGGVEHYGYWNNKEPNLLVIKDEDNSWRRQYQVKGEEE
tara:strand:- start:255 stop:815 length:561 start_codon:yes stop_codon:yes gene_type:complete